MKKFLAITPYFGGISSAPRQTELNNVLRYFEYTYSSLKPYMTRLIVSVYKVFWIKPRYRDNKN